MACGNRVHVGSPGSSGVISVRNYKNFMECDYKITTGDQRATISVLVHQIDVEYSRGCIYDSLTVSRCTCSCVECVESCFTNILCMVHVFKI